MATTLDTTDLEAKVKEMYRRVAENPGGEYHFELGRALAERLGYDAALLDKVPAGAVDSFAGVGYFFDLAGLQPGEHVLDLGSGSGMDSFYAAELVGPTGSVLGVDFTPEQLTKARSLIRAGDPVAFRTGRIEGVPADDAAFDCVISNGVINLAPDKRQVFAEAARVLRPGGRLTAADIITERPLTDAIVESADLWASCIGGAAHADVYWEAIESAGLRVIQAHRNPYQFLSAQARGASKQYGVMSVSLIAVKPKGSNPSS